MNDFCAAEDAPTGRTIGALCSGGSGQLHQHSDDESSVSVLRNLFIGYVITLYRH